jgi:hypothetical protein
MKKLTLAAAAMTLALTPALYAADPMSGAPTTPAANNAAPADASNNPSTMGASNAQTAPADWTALKGTVESIDANAKTLQIKDEMGQSVSVSIDKQVSIQKDGKSVKLNQVKPGDSITLAKKGSAAPASKAY